MLTMIKKIFTWWNQDTLGTKLKTILFGKFAGSDEFGNKYYEGKNKDNDINKKYKSWKS